jgi:RNA polymerase sigma-70 factor, ECF subfamily
MVDSPQVVEEAQIIAAIVRGETRLFHDLIRPHERSVYMVALSLLQNEADAEDAAQEAFLNAFRNLSKFRAESRFSTWLIRIALNEARSKRRQKKAMKTESLDAGSEEDGHVPPAILRDWREVPSESLERMEVRQMIQLAVAELPGIYREIFLLRDVEELSVNESAEALGVSIASVKVRLHRARRMLQKTLAPQLKQVNPKRGWFSWL